jgi:hypothetical protein
VEINNPLFQDAPRLSTHNPVKAGFIPFTNPRGRPWLTAPRSRPSLKPCSIALAEGTFSGREVRLADYWRKVSWQADWQESFVS